MIDKIKSKKDIRAEMEKGIEEYLKEGGKIDTINQGVSGRESNVNLNQTIAFTPGEFKTRTLVNDTVKAIDERKKPQKTNPNIKNKPTKRIIYDDFGEPIREVWE